MSSRSIDDLSPEVKRRAGLFLSRCAASGLCLLVTCTRRTAAEQAALYAQGRAAGGRVVTWAKPGQSLHETGAALDVVPLRHGKPVWTTSGADLELWREVGEIGEGAGLEWAGRWPARVREYPHFQFNG